MKKFSFISCFVLCQMVVLAQSNYDYNLEIKNGLYKKFILNDIGLILNVNNEKFENKIFFYPINPNDNRHNDIQRIVRENLFFSTSKEVLYSIPVLDMPLNSLYMHGSNTVKTFYYDCCKEASIDSLIRLINSFILSYNIKDTIQILWWETCDSCIKNDIDVFQPEKIIQQESSITDFYFELVIDNCRLFTYYSDTGIILYDISRYHNNPIFIPRYQKREKERKWSKLYQNVKQVIQQVKSDTLSIGNNYMLYRVNGKWGYINSVNRYEMERILKDATKIASLKERRKINENNKYLQKTL